MENKLYNAFDKIHAEDALKKNTLDFLLKEIQKRGNIRKPSYVRLAAVFASLVLILLAGGISFNLYFTPDAYVDVDVNPSVELTLNRFGRVIEAIPYNDDGALILRDVNVHHKSCDEAACILLEAMTDSGYLKQDGLISVTVQAKDGDTEKRLLDYLQSAVSDSLTSHHTNASADIFAVSYEVKECAYKYEMTPAKYLAIAQLQEVDPTAAFETCNEHSISEIRQLIVEHGGGHHGGRIGGGQQNQSTDEDCETEEDCAAPSNGQAGHGHNGGAWHGGNGHN